MIFYFTDVLKENIWNRKINLRPSNEVYRGLSLIFEKLDFTNCIKMRTKDFTIITDKSELCIR